MEEDFQKIYTLKGRDTTKKLAFLVRDFEELRKIALISAEQIDFLKKYPFPFSVLLPSNPKYHFPEFLKIDNYSLISVRIWEKCLPKNILQKISFPLFLTSANFSGESEATTFSEAVKNFSNIFGFDGGKCDNNPSNIFSFDENFHKNGKIHFLRKNYENEVK